MRGIDQLLDLLKQQGIERRKASVFDYRRPVFVLLGIFMVTVAIAAASAIIWQRATTDMPYTINGVRQSGPPPWGFVILFVSIWSGGFGLAGIYLVMRAQNERIVIDGDQILWTDWRGRLRTVASLSSLRPDCVSEKVTTGRGGSQWYSYIVTTPSGPIKFDQYIRHSRDLIDTINQTSQRPRAPILAGTSEPV